MGYSLVMLQFVDSFITLFTQVANKQFYSLNAIVRISNVIIKGFLSAQLLSTPTAYEITPFIMDHFHV